MYRLFGIDLKSWVSIISWIWYANTHHTHFNVCRLQMNWKFDRNDFLKYSTIFFVISPKYKTSDNCLIFCRTDVVCRFHCNAFAMILHAHAAVYIVYSFLNVYDNNMCNAFKAFGYSTCSYQKTCLAKNWTLPRIATNCNNFQKHRRLCEAMRMGYESTRFVWS